MKTYKLLLFEKIKNQELLDILRIIVMNLGALKIRILLLTNQMMSRKYLHV